MTINAKQFQKQFDAIVDNVGTVIHGKDDVIRLALVGVLARGHLLIEDVPGVGKTTLGDRKSVV